MIPDDIGCFDQHYGSFPTRYQFTGREFDSFSALQYSRARFYDPQIGRFISEDPIGFSGGDVNLYGYVKNRPTMYRDPTGLEFFADPDSIYRYNRPRPPIPSTAHLGAYDVGIDAEKRNFPPYSNPYEGGYRHCVSACVLGKRYGGTVGRALVFLWDIQHEGLLTDPSGGDNPTDRRAEHEGLACATSSAGDETVCEVDCLRVYPGY